jgi:hypothetical protein
MVFKSVLNGA